VLEIFLIANVKKTSAAVQSMSILMPMSAITRSYSIDIRRRNVLLAPGSFLSDRSAHPTDNWRANGGYI